MVLNSKAGLAATLILIALVTALAHGQSDNCANSALSPAGLVADQSAIRELIGHMQDAWNRGDFRGYMQGFKNPDVIFVSGGRFQDGWQGTLDHYIKNYGTSPETRGTLRFYDIRIEMLAPDAAQLISHFELKPPRIHSTGSTPD